MEQETFTKKDVLAILEMQNEQTLKNLMAFVKELKKPTEIEQAKLDADALKLKRQQTQRLELQKAEVIAKENRKKYCPHGTTHPGTHAFHPAWVAQVNSDGFWRPTCQQCWTQLKPIKATQYELQNGVNLNLYRSLDVATLEKLAEQRASA